MAELLDDPTEPVPRVGCASWSLSRYVTEHFPVEGSHLERYASVFNAAEINSSFYKPHRPATYERWRDSTPPGFRFAVKAPKTITHERRLVGFDNELARFAEEANTLGAKLAWILVQLPPKLEFDADAAQDALAQIQRAFGCGVALEARHRTWFADRATALLTGLGVTRVVADPRPCEPDVHVPTTNAYYIRLHGSPRMYYSSYDGAYLARMAQAMRDHIAAGHAAWCLFDNTAGQQAVPNGLTLLRYLKEQAR